MSSSAQPSPAQVNAMARSLIKAKAVPMLQQIFNSTYGAAANTTDVSNTQPVVNVIPRNVGLIRGFWVKIVAVYNNQSGQTATVSDFGPANILNQIQFNDLNNNTRIQTTGWHVDFINSIKARRPFGASLIRGGSGSTTGGIDAPTNYGSNFGSTFIIFAPQTIANNAAANVSTVTMWWYVPLAYSPDDLRGSVYANVVNATMQLNLTFNTRSGVLASTDSTSAVYTLAAGATAASFVMSQATVTVYQDYLDQIPAGQSGPILPVLDLATIYELKNTTVTAIVPAQDFPVQYSNFRDFLSTIAIFVNTGSSGARASGSDINTWALQSANFTNIWKLEPGLIATRTRNHLGTDMPPGTYYFGSREKPISTTQYGNMQLVLNAITAGAGAYMLLGYEDLALVQTLSVAGSLAAS
jgi:P3 major capsid protein